LSHFSRREWENYIKSRLTEDETALMEGHLLECEDCLETFLSTIDDEEIALAAGQLSPDFTNTVMAKTKTLQRQNSTLPRRDRRTGTNLFMYYVAASIVTLMLMSVGVFQSMMNIVPEFNAAADHRKLQYSINLDGPDKVTNSAHRWLQKFEMPGKGRY
jgi:hypothetical protein